MLAEGSDLRNFRIIRPLGQGGFGITYLVEDRILQKKFAMKEYFPKDFAHRYESDVFPLSGQVENFTWGKERFLDEARTLARFTHPNIVGVNQIFEENNTAYMILDYQSGRNFLAWLQEVILPSQEDLDFIIKPLLSAFQLIHKNNVLHRDVAPDNIFIRDDGTPVLLDFGSAREAFALKTKIVSAVVKTGFSPPEQYSTRGTGQGPWTDIYALAATLYLAVSGMTPDEATERILDDQLVPLKETASSAYRQSFLCAIDWALSIKPKDRPQSIDEWQAQLIDLRNISVTETAPVIPIPDTEAIFINNDEKRDAFPGYRLGFVLFVFLFTYVFVLLNQSSKQRIAGVKDTNSLQSNQSDILIDKNQRHDPLNNKPNDLETKKIQTQSIRTNGSVKTTQEQNQDNSQKIDVGIPMPPRRTVQDLLLSPTTGSPVNSTINPVSKMPISIQTELDLFMQERYKKCWIYSTKSPPDYIVQIKVEYTPEGGLVGSPLLINPPRDPRQKIISDTAIKAVHSCDPLQIPSQFRQYHEEWKSRILRFDPKVKVDGSRNKVQTKIEYEDGGYDTSIKIKDIKDGKIKQFFDDF